MDAFTEEQKAVLRVLAVMMDRKFRRTAVQFLALMRLLAMKGVVTFEEVESAIAETEADVAIESTMDPGIRSLEELLGEGPQEEKG